MPKEENSMEANKIKETLKDLEEQADHHAEIIQICDDDIEYWWDGLEVAWYQLQNDKKLRQRIQAMSTKRCYSNSSKIAVLGPVAKI